MEKMTNAKAIGYVLDNFVADLPTDVVDKLTAIKANFEKKRVNKGNEKKQAENDEYKAVIKSVLTTEGATVTEIMTKDSTLASLSNQKISALLRQMVESGEVIKTTDKKKSLFAVAA